MAQTKTAQTAPSDEVTIDDFCVDLSGKDRRVEMIGAFHFSERQASRVKDSALAYSARYQAFLSQPA